jgi:hypothetical protein
MRLTPVWVSDATTLRLEFQDGAAKPLVTFAVKRDVGKEITAARLVPKTTFAQIAAVLLSEFGEILDEDGMAGTYNQAMIDSRGE